MPDDTLTLDRGRPVTDAALLRRADWIRLQTLDLIAQAGLGHYSSTFSCAEIVAALYYRELRLRPSEPRWADRDRFLLGKGHAATGLWPVLADLGFYPQDWLKQFGRVGSPLNDHPNMKLAPGIDFSSGSLGHNLSVGTGMALAGRLSGRDYRTFVLTGDGELQEGQVWEAAMAASHYKLGNLVAIVDANGFSGAGRRRRRSTSSRSANGSPRSAGRSGRSTGTTSPRSGPPLTSCLTRRARSRS